MEGTEANVVGSAPLQTYKVADNLDNVCRVENLADCFLIDFLHVLFDIPAMGLKKPETRPEHVLRLRLRLDSSPDQCFIRYCDDMLWLLCTRRIVSAKRRATERMVHFVHVPW